MSKHWHCLHGIRIKNIYSNTQFCGFITCVVGPWLWNALSTAVFVGIQKDNKDAHVQSILLLPF